MSAKWLDFESPVCNTGGFVQIRQPVEVVGWGVDDLHLAWDYSDSPSLGRLLERPYVPSKYGRVLGERGSFGEWQSDLAHYATFSADSTRRLLVQFKPRVSGVLTVPGDVASLVEDFERGMAVRGLECYGTPVVRRIDVAVDVRCDSGTGRLLIDAMGAVRLSGGRRTEMVGDPRSTVYFRPRKGRGVLARTYCRNLKTGQGEPYGLIRMEAQHRFEFGSVPFDVVASGDLLRPLWLQRFGDEVGATVRRIGREAQTMTLLDLVESGALSVSQAERLSMFLDSERLGRARSVYPAALYARRKREARELGLAPNDDDGVVLDVELDALLAPARAAWD